MASATATMAQIRAGFVANLTSLNATWAVYEYPISDPTPPYITVLGANVNFDAAMRRGSDTLNWTILACVPVSIDQAAAALLETMIDPTSSSSLKTLLETDPTLGGVVSWARVVSVSRPNLYTMPGQPEALGVEFLVEVMT